MSGHESLTVLEWRVHPAQKHWKRAVAAAVIIICLAWGAAGWMENAWWGVGAAMFLLFSLRRFYLPMNFRVDDDGVTATNWLSQRHLDWQQIRRFDYDSRGGFLATRARPSLLDNRRGVHLLFDESQAEVVSRIERHLAENRRS